ncbi:MULTISPECIES: C45 family autoproteolytic acyltransferase/hydolase [Streptomyces]|uniref:Isopenicillin-N N-acyltransferase-like protein n=1 Tax=Streptomyces nymphaeiformis TaxID=2663842 RepID=A0A7W7U056_9ACTN|nr:C45 family peptidase [Streptomyces nymphaeiformis]MBB4981210.1 isopenicillin-N N-acyltransferase-like protein [Streptomyces nymphaeiformis]
MELHTLITGTTDPRERGTLLGTRFGAQVRRVAELYREHFAVLGLPADRVRDLAGRSHEALRAWAPHLAEESDACADAAGVERWTVAAVGARTEILAACPEPGKGECSTAVFAPAGAAPQTVQTWDWHDLLVPDALLHALTPSEGRTVKLFTEFGAPGKIGVNSAGLGVHFNILFHASDSAGGGVPVHAVARRILDEADTLDRAVEIASTARVSASTSLTVVTADCSAASLELSPAGLAVVPAGEDGWLLHTNHFLDAGLAAGDTGPADSMTAERLAHLRAVRAAMPGLSPAERARAFCGEGGADAVVCMRPDAHKPPHEQWGTLLTVGLDTADCAIDYLAGAPHEAPASGLARF